MKRPILYFFSFCIFAMCVLVVCILLSMHSDASSDGSEPEPEVETGLPEESAAPVEIFGRVEYRHDLIDLRTLFVEARAYPGAGFPLVSGGYTETNVHALIRIRDLIVPTACQTPESRQNRPHAYIERERARWAAGMEYVWSILKINKMLKLVNPTLAEDGIVECDVRFYLGGAWHELDTALIQDDYARRTHPGYTVDWGSKLLDVVPIAENAAVGE